MVRRTAPSFIGRAWVSFWERYAAGNDMLHIWVANGRESSRHLRLRPHEAFDGLPLTTNRREECVQMQVKWSDQPPLPPLGVPGVTAVIRAASLACQNAGKAQKFVPLWDSSGESRLRRTFRAAVGLPETSEMQEESAEDKRRKHPDLWKGLPTK
jgi:hypothetical protein